MSGKRGVWSNWLFEDVAAARLVGAAVERAVFAVSEDKVATASRAFAGGYGKVAPMLV